MAALGHKEVGKLLTKCLAGLDNEVLWHVCPVLIDNTLDELDNAVAHPTGLVLHVQSEFVVEGIRAVGLTHSLCPRESNDLVRNVWVILGVWVVAPSCWNTTFPSGKLAWTLGGLVGLQFHSLEMWDAIQHQQKLTSQLFNPVVKPFVVRFSKFQQQ